MLQNFRLFLLLISFSMAYQVNAEPLQLTMYKQAGCMCCDKHAEILEQEGFKVTIKENVNLNLLKSELEIPEEFMGCHTMIVDKYIVEGHVPGEIILRLLQEKPDIRGISLPGMPIGSPGMPGPRNELLDVYVIDENNKTSFAQF